MLVEDCRTTRRYVRRLLEEYDDLHVLPPAVDGLEAIEKAIELQPDVILTDLHLPRVDGVEAIATIMAEQPCPIVVLSGELSRRDTDFTFEALNAGAVKVIAKPSGLARRVRREFAEDLANTLRLMSNVEVVTGRAPTQRGLVPASEVFDERPELTGRAIDAVAIGASTGGPATVYEILNGLPTPFPIPLFVAQHITEGFEHGLCRWLQTTGHDIEIPLPGADIRPETVYLSPANASLTVGPNNIEIVPAVGDELTPSINRLFTSMARYCRERCVGILLTGMGRDGVEGLADIEAAGGWTIAQQPDSAVIDSMPATAMEAGVVNEELEPGAIIKRLQRLSSTKQLP